VKFGADGLHAVPFGTWQFHDTRCSEGHILLKGVNEIFPYLVRFGLIRYQKNFTQCRGAVWIIMKNGVM
jgi:hypothetical protein